MTKNELKAELDERGIDYPPRATKPVLQAILDDNPIPEEPTEPVTPIEEEMTDEEVAEATEEISPLDSNGAPKPDYDFGCPPEHPQAGDRTPEVVAWRRKHWPKVKFMKRYAGRNVDLAGC